MSRCLPGAGAEQITQQTGRRVAASGLRLRAIEVARRRGQRDQVRHRNLMRDLTAIGIGDGIEVARLQQRAAVRGRVHGVGQPDALLDDPAQPVHGDQRRDGAGQQDEARDQGLPALRRRMAVARHHLPPATLPP